MKWFASVTLSLSLVLSATAGEKSAKAAPLANLILDVSAAAVNQGVQRTIDRTEPFQEFILDTPVFGTARTRGFVTAELLPDSSRAALDVVFRGQVEARSVGERLQVMIHTFDTTPLEIRRRVVIDASGIQSIPGQNFGYTHTELLDVVNRHGDMGWRQVDLARRMFLRNKHFAEQEGACKAADTLAARLGEELAPNLEALAAPARKRLNRARDVSMKLESMQFSSSPAALQGRLRWATATPGPTSLPDLPADVDLGIRIHQSVVNEIARAEFGGRTVHIDRLSEFYDEVTQGVLAPDQQGLLKLFGELVTTIAGEPVSATLASRDPLTVTFGDQRIDIDLHLASVRSGKTDYAGVRIKASYRLDNLPPGVVATRQGPVRLELAKADKQFAALPDGNLFFVELLADQLFKERMVVNALAIPDGLPEVRVASPRAGAQNGWFAVAWKLK